MGKYSKLLSKIFSGTSAQNIDFAELCRLLIHLGFKERIKGDHHIFFRDDIEEIINLQPKRNKAKAYQIKQVRNILIKYKIGEINHD